MKNSNLENLLAESPEAYYWIGFLMADGHFSEKRMTAILSIKDKEHLLKLASFVNNENLSVYKKSVGLRCMDSKIVPKIRRKFGIVNRKTYHPCKIPIRNNSLFLSLLIGFIDGDGCICKNTRRRDSHIKIKCHASWLKNFIIMKERLSKIVGIEVSEPKINKQGYACWAITNTPTLRFLKKKTLELKIPVIDRKWRNIDQDFVSREEIARMRSIEVSKLLKTGARNIDIANRLGISKSTVTQIIKRDNL
jgi:hypothetical protein